MNKKHENYQKMLEAKRLELTQSNRKRDELAVQAAPDLMDQLQLATEREMAIDQVSRNSRLLLEIRDAMMRIDFNEYGLCIDCEEEISEKRLNAVPWAPRCIQCQEAKDSLGSQVGEPVLELSVTA